MNREKMLTQLAEEIDKNLPGLGVWQGLGLALMVFSLLKGGHSQISQMAEGLSQEGSYNTVRQRFKRWLSNPRLNWTQLGEEWVRWVWRSYAAERAMLLVDETKLGDRFGVMMVSLAYGGRAIPLWWRCYLANSAADYPPQGQVLLIYGLLAHVLAVLPAAAHPLVQMDRGLGHSRAMIRALRDLKVDFLLRVKSNARFRSVKGTSQLLKHWAWVGQDVYVSGTLFDRDHVCRGTICLIWEVGHAEPWCLFTNLKSRQGRAYAHRWWQEESFRDLKSGGWQWSQSHLSSPQRMERLVLIMAIAYAFAIRSGILVWQQPPRVRANTATTDELQRLSLFHLGRRWLKRVFDDAAAFQRLALHFPTTASFLCV